MKLGNSVTEILLGEDRTHTHLLQQSQPKPCLPCSNFEKSSAKNGILRRNARQKFNS